MSREFIRVRHRQHERRRLELEWKYTMTRSF